VRESEAACEAVCKALEGWVTSGVFICNQVCNQALELFFLRFRTFMQTAVIAGDCDFLTRLHLPSCRTLPLGIEVPVGVACQPPTAENTGSHYSSGCIWCLIT
jgi:hypothetical protein